MHFLCAEDRAVPVVSSNRPGMKHLSNIFHKRARLYGMLYSSVNSWHNGSYDISQRDLHVLHHSQGSIVANSSYLGGSVPTSDIKNIAISTLYFLMALSYI